MTEEKPQLTRIPQDQIDQIDPDTLNRLIESFVLREGTDYGSGSEVLLETKVNQVRRQLDQKKVFIVYDPLEESVTIMTEHEWSRSQSQHDPETRPD